MTDKPIIFSAPMVRALLEGRKTQTRRLAKVTWSDGANREFTGWHPERAGMNRWQLVGGMGVGATIAVPYAPGDRLYVREAFCPRLGYPAAIAKPHYRADDDKPEWRGLWKPSIHMPRWASRLTLTVTEVRVQRLQEISEADCFAEGVEQFGGGAAFVKLADAQTYSTPRGCYHALWNSLHGPDAWDANPWVVALTFTVQYGNIDQVKS